MNYACADQKLNRQTPLNGEKSSQLANLSGCSRPGGRSRQVFSKTKRHGLPAVYYY